MMRCAVLLSAAALTVVISTARADLRFHLNPATGMDPAALAGFQAAADRWSANFTNTVDLSIDVDFTPLGFGILGQTSTTDAIYSYTDVRSALSARQSSADDAAAVVSLPAASVVPIWINHTSQNRNSATPYLDAGTDTNLLNKNNNTIRLSNANARILGFNPSGSADASIAFNSGYTWDFDPSDGVASNAFDFIGIATHEIGHALGFRSGVDYLDQRPGLSEDKYNYVSAADLFRYSADSAAQGAIDWTADDRAKYFSLDQGATAIAGFATGVNLGDGAQASHWKDNLGLGIMDPTANYGERLTVTENDLRLFDVIGYSRNYTWKWAAGVNGTWSEGVRWNTDAVPNSQIAVVFATGGHVYNVSLAANAAAKALTITTDQGAFSLGAKTLAVSGDIVIGQAAGDNARLSAFGPGTITAQRVHIAQAASSTGNVTLTGTTLNVAGNLYVGGSDAGPGGTGSLTLNPSSAVNIGGALTVYPAGTLTLAEGTVSASAISLAGQLTALASNTLSAPLTVTDAAISTNAGTLTLAGPLAITDNAALTKEGPAALEIDGPQSHGLNALLTILDGSVAMTTDPGSLADAPLSIQISNADLHLATAHLDALSLGTGSTVTITGNVLSVTSLDFLNTTFTARPSGSPPSPPSPAPEPASLATLALCMPLLLRRRKA